MLKARQKLGKYRILRRITSGPLADVYAAFDTIHKTRVALKIPRVGSGVSSEDFLREVQVAAKLRHPNILSVQNASYIGDHFVIAMELGTESLADRLFRRMSTARALELADQALAGLAHAHSHKIIHCDIKPENYILFPDNVLKLTDFGFAKISLRTLKASGSGTIDYIAPEQAMGRPKFQSDVFSVGLVLYRMFSGILPEWPFSWPMPGSDRLVARVRPEFVSFLRRAIQLDPSDRYRDAIQMYDAYKRLQIRERAEEGAIEVFAKNIKDLLLAAPAGKKVTMGLDPGLRTGVKLTVVDGTGQVLAHDAIFPTAPQFKIKEAGETVLRLCRQHKVELVSIGNGTASRETDQFIAALAKSHPELKLRINALHRMDCIQWLAHPIRGRMRVRAPTPSRRGWMTRRTWACGSPMAGRPP